MRQRALLLLLLSVIPSTSLPTRPSLSVVLPAFNERKRLPPTLEQSLNFLELSAADRDWELLVVDDGSDDGTANWAAAQRPDDARLRVIRSPTNCGKGAALAAGVLHATGERLLFMDADGGTPLSALPSLEAVMDARGCGVVVGARGGEKNKRVWYREIMGVVFAALTATCVSSEVKDTQCGFKLLTREAALSTMPHLRVRRWAYDVELLFLCEQLNLGVASCPVPSTDVAGSKITALTPAEMALDVLKVSLLYRVGPWDLPSGGAAQEMVSETGERGAAGEYVEVSRR